MIMTAFKQAKRNQAKQKRKNRELLPLEEYIAKKLGDKAQASFRDSIDALPQMANIRAWEMMAVPPILEHEGKNRLLVRLIRRGIDDIIDNGKSHILSQVASYSGSLSREHLDMLVYCLSLAQMKGVMARMATYPFFERNPGFEADCSASIREKGLISLKDYAEVLCHYMDCDGGPKAFSHTQDHNYVLLMYSAFHPSFAARIRAVENFFLVHFREPLDFKEAVLHTPYPETAGHILDKLLGSGMMAVKGSASDNSLIIWYYDCISYRGSDDRVAKEFEARLEGFGYSRERLHDILHEVLGVPRGPIN